MAKHVILLLCGVLCAMAAYAQEAEDRESTYNIASYMTSSPTGEELETMHKRRLVTGMRTLRCSKMRNS